MKCEQNGHIKFWHFVSVFVLCACELWLGNRKHPIVLDCSWLCGEQEAPHCSCSIIPAGQEESLHLLQLSVPPSPPFVLGQPWLRASLQVRTTKCNRAQHCSTSLMSVIDSPSTPASIFPQGIDQKKKINLDPKMRSMGARTHGILLQEAVSKLHGTKCLLQFILMALSVSCLMNNIQAHGHL